MTYLEASAVIDGEYRYALRRSWADRSNVGRPFRWLAFVMLNPSTADGTKDDPTIRRCVGFARSWGFDGITVANLFALRATDPTAAISHPSPIGPRNDAAIAAAVQEAELVVAAWGALGCVPYRARAADVEILATRWRPLHALGLTKEHGPRHPLYVKGSARPIPYRMGGGAPA